MTLFDKLRFVRPSPALLAVDLVLFGFLCALGILWMAIVASRTDNRVALVAHGLFTAYLVVVACLVFLPLHGIRAAAAGFDGTRPLVRAWNWGLQIESPFLDGRIQLQRLGNILMTIPFGFGFGLLAPRLGVRRIFAACIAWAVSFELIQLTISVVLGFTYRTFDINDIIDNVAGAWIGLAFFVAFTLIVRRTGFGAHAPGTTFRGFLAESVNQYFDGFAERRRPGVDPIDRAG